jgi:long-chain-fatty-acid--CoA ligase ACSBG
MFEWANKIAAQELSAQFRGAASESVSLEYKLARAVILSKIHKELGLDKCRHFYSGAAPLTKKTLDFFVAIGIPLCEVYGMSESSAHNMGVWHRNKLNSIGLLNEYNKSKLIDTDHEGCGELAMYGRHLFMGYLNDHKKTVESFDSDGWYIKTSHTYF